MTGDDNGTAWIDEIRQRLQDHIKETGISRGKLSRTLGYSTPVISMFLAGKYAQAGGDAFAVAKRVEDMLGVNAQRKAVPTPPAFAMTSVAKAVIGDLQTCHSFQEFGVIVGDAGLGKTKGLEQYAAQHPTAVLLRARSTAATPLYLLHQIARALRMKASSSIFDALEQVIEALRGSGRLLIIDEAQHLSARSLETMRDIYDEAQVGVVLCGNGKVYNAVHGSGTAAFAQLFSRLGTELVLDSKRLTVADVDAVVGGELEGDKESRAFLLRLARSRGGLRTMMKTYMGARRLAVSAPGESFAQLLKAAHAMRKVDTGSDDVSGEE